MANEQLKSTDVKVIWLVNHSKQLRAVFFYLLLLNEAGLKIDEVVLYGLFCI